MFLGLRTVIYQVNDLEKAKAWYGRVLGLEPYFDEPYYVGFNVGGYELGLDPDVSSASPAASNAVAYWGVDDADASLTRLIELGASKQSDLQNVGHDIRVAAVIDPFGNVFGIIENPHFSLEPR